MRTLVLLWVWCCAYLNCAGWTLSALNELNPFGYAVALVLGFGALLIWRKTNHTRFFPKLGWQKLRHRFRRLLPAAYLTLAVAAVAGGLLYPPNNLDEFTYRLPRVLHWLAEGHWHWIHSPDARMNDRSSGFEWLTAPLLALTKSDRLFFLPNALSFLFLPGLIYSTFIRLGIARRVAWHWMWLLPAGFNFALQAGSVANDLFGVVFALAAMDGALRFGESRSRSELWLSILAAGLMTGAKMSNLPLLLPWLGALLLSFVAPTGKPVGKPFVLALVCLGAVLSSCLPNAVLNVKNGNDWTGSNLENPRFRIHDPLVGITGNMIVWSLSNLQPPVMPLSHAAGEKLLNHLIPQKFLDFYDDHFEGHFINFMGSGIQTEEGAGFGVAVWCLWLGSALASLFCRRHSFGADRAIVGGNLNGTRRIVLLVLPWIAFLVYLANAGMGQEGRLLSPYYPLIIPLLLVSPTQESIVRRWWWRGGAVIAFFMAGTLLVLAPARPLLPCERLLQNFQKGEFLDRARMSYLAYSHRGDQLARVRALIPPEVSVIGFASKGNEIEPSLWRPFGTRRVVYVLPGDTAADLRRLGVEYLVIGDETLAARKQSLEDWLKEYDAEKVGQVTINSLYSPYPPFDWYVSRFSP